MDLSPNIPLSVIPSVTSSFGYNTPSKKLIFISYRQKTCKKLADRLYHRLKAYDSTREVFWDENEIRVSEEWKKVFMEKLSRAGLFLPIISRSTLETFKNSGDVDHVLLEWNYAIDHWERKQLIIIPLFILETAESEFNFKDINLHTTCASGCKRSFKEIWEIFNGIKGLQVNFEVHNDMRVLEFEINNLFPVSPSLSTFKQAVVSDWITKPRYFIGRQDLLNGITQILSNPLQTRAVVIHGGPGMGKTTIVSEYATKVHATFYTHVLWISLTTETSFSDSILRSCELLGIQVEVDTEKVKNLVFNWLSTHNGYLLILDNADEHILVENCLKGLRRISGHVLITTRNSVIDQHIALGMSYSDIFHRKIDVWTDELSRQYINARFPDLEYSESESVALKRILELMGGYPLVIEQMCSYISFVQSCNFADYLEKLTSGSDENIWKFEPLIGVSNYQRTLDSTIEIALEYFKNNGKTFCCILLGGIAAIGTKDIPITTYLQTYLQHAGFKNTPIQTAISPIVEMSLITINSNKRTVSTHLAIRDAIRRRLGFAKTNPENTLRRKPAFSSDQIDFTWLAIYAMKELIPKSHNGTYDAKSVSTGPQLLPHVSELVAVSKTPNPTLAKICDVAGDFADYISSFNIGRSLFLNAIQMNTEINKGSRVCESVAHSITGLANIEKKRGDFDEAKKLFTECLEIYFKVHGTRMHTSVAATLNNLGYIARKQKRFDEAKKLYAESLDIYKTTDPTKPQAVVANAFDNLGSIAYYEEDYDEAFRLYSECLKIKEQIYGNRRHTRLAPSINHLGNIANRLKKYDEAVTLYTESLEIYEEAFGTRQHPYIANIIGNLGTIEKSRGRNEESVRFYKECLAISEKAYGTRNHSDIAKTLSNLGQVYEKMGNREEAVVNYKESLKIYKIVFGEDYPSYIKVQNALQSFVV